MLVIYMCVSEFTCVTSEFIFAGLFPLKFRVMFAVQIAEDFVFVKCHTNAVLLLIF